MIGPRVGIKTGPRAGLAVGVGADQIARPSSASTWTVDAASGKGVPATIAEWQLLCATVSGSSAPSYLHLMQEASGDLADTIGTMTLTAAGTPTYQQAQSGWTRTAFRTPDGGAHGASAAAGVGFNPSTTSVAVLTYVGLTTPVSTRQVISIEDNQVVVQQLATGVLRIIGGGVSTDGATVYTGFSVFPSLLVYDRTNSRARHYSNVEKVSPAYAATTNNRKSISRPTAAASANARYLYTAWFTGAAAEWLSADANAKALLTALGWTVTGY